MFAEIPMYLREGYKNKDPKRIAESLQNTLVGYINSSHVDGRPVANAEISNEDGHIHLTHIYPILTEKALDYPNPHCYGSSNGMFTKIPIYVDYHGTTWNRIKCAMKGDTYKFKVKFESALCDILRNVHKDSSIVPPKERNSKDFTDFSTFLTKSS